MKLVPASVLAGTVTLLLALAPAGLRAQDAPPESMAPPAGSIEWLREENQRLGTMIEAYREQLATAELELASCHREVEELRQFVNDHHEFGDDFAKYRAVKASAERAERRQEAEAQRERREAELAARETRRSELRAQRTRENAEAARLDRYRDAGFSHLGLDVFVGKMAFSYGTSEFTPIRSDYRVGFGRYLRPYPSVTAADYSRMTISGSVLNVADDVRNVGIAITFFDESGNQVGGEIIQINNARPEVPYPFTSTIDMALDRPFHSSSTYVLYTDPVSGVSD